MNDQQIDTLLDVLSRRPFRAKFRLGSNERDIIYSKGRPTIRQHTFDIISQRLASAYPHKDGKQTPYKGHPVFIAQHATATCCRSCLMRWHHIPKGKELGHNEKIYVTRVIIRWLQRQLVLLVDAPRPKG